MSHILNKKVILLLTIIEVSLVKIILENQSYIQFYNLLIYATVSGKYVFSCATYYFMFPAHKSQSHESASYEI